MTTAEEPRPSEEAALDRAINSMDPILRASLQRDQKQRRRKMLIAGGVLMAFLTTVGVCLVLNWAAIFGTEVQPGALAGGADAQQLTDAGWQLWQQQKYVEAEAKFKSAVALDAKLDNAWNGLGWSQFNQGKSEDAIKAFKKCVKLNPQHGAALNGLGQAHYALGKYDSAERFFIEAENVPAAHFGLLRLYVMQGKFQKAQKWYDKIAATAGPEELALLEPYKNAIAAKQQLGKISVDVEKPTSKGWQLFNQGKNQQAEVLFRQALKADANHLPAINGLAFCLLNQGKADVARPMFEQLLKEEPNHFGAINGLARCLKSEGKTDGAIKLWKDMQEKLPGFNAATTGLGMTYFELKQYADAIPYLEKMVAGDPNNRSFSEMLEKAKRKVK